MVNRTSHYQTSFLSSICSSQSVLYNLHSFICPVTNESADYIFSTLLFEISMGYIFFFVFGKILMTCTCTGISFFYTIPIQPHADDSNKQLFSIFQYLVNYCFCYVFAFGFNFRWNKGQYFGINSYYEFQFQSKKTTVILILNGIVFELFLPMH